MNPLLRLVLPLTEGLGNNIKNDTLRRGVKGVGYGTYGLTDYSDNRDEQVQALLSKGLDPAQAEIGAGGLGAILRSAPSTAGVVLGMLPGMQLPGAILETVGGGIQGLDTASKRGDDIFGMLGEGLLGAGKGALGGALNFVTFGGANALKAGKLAKGLKGAKKNPFFDEFGNVIPNGTPAPVDPSDLEEVLDVVRFSKR